MSPSIAHPLQGVLGQAERLVVGLDHLHQPAFQRADRAQVGEGHRLDVPELCGPGGIDDHLDRRPRERQIALPAEHRTTTQAGAKRQHPIARAIRGGLGRQIAVGRLVPAGEQAVESPGEERGGREVVRGHVRTVRSHCQREDLERLLEPALVLEVVRIGHQAQPQAG